jgi:fructose-1,6-bisphosphatase/inositol monophosphatase family enzyme
VVDPVDGSTNASRRIPYYATSLCAVDADGPFVAVVVNQATGERFEAVRGGGARRDGEPIAPSQSTTIERSIVGLCGMPAQHWGWAQARVLGAAALDLCAVACGRLDAYVDHTGTLAPWDYLGGMLVCQEAGAVVANGSPGELVVLEPSHRGGPIAAATPELLASLLDRRALG